MGYSYTAIAGFAETALMKQLQDRGTDQKETSNGWEHKGVSYFFEHGREQDDGSITGTVWKNLPVNQPCTSCDKPGCPGAHCRKAGTVQIESDGTVTRFPTTTKAMKLTATFNADREYARIYGPPAKVDGLFHVPDYLREKLGLT